MAVNTVNNSQEVYGENTIDIEPVFQCNTLLKDVLNYDSLMSGYSWLHYIYESIRLWKRMYQRRIILFVIATA